MKIAVLNFRMVAVLALCAFGCLANANADEKQSVVSSMSSTTLSGYVSDSLYFDSTPPANVGSCIITADSGSFQAGPGSTISPVPEPSTMALIAVGVAGFYLQQRKKNQRAR